MAIAGHCVDINGDYWHYPGECRGAIDNCDGRCCAPVEPKERAATTSAPQVPASTDLTAPGPDNAAGAVGTTP